MQICILSNITYGYRLLQIMLLLLIEQKIFATRNTMWYISFRPNLKAILTKRQYAEQTWQPLPVGQLINDPELPHHQEV